MNHPSPVFHAAGRADGYAMAVLMVGIAMMGIMLGVAMPVWHQTMQREKEEELIFRGNQYARAVGLFQRKNGNAFPPSLDVLVQQKFLRKKYKDPMVEDGVFQLIPAGAMQAGQVGPTMPGSGGRGASGQTPSQFGSQFGSQSASQFGSQSGSQFGDQGGGSRFGGSRSSSGMQTVVTAIAGVVSKNTDKSIRIYNGRQHYNEWFFTYQGNVGNRGVLVPGGGRGRGPGGSGPGGRGRGGFGPGSGFDPTQFPPDFPGGGRGRGRGRGQ